MTTFLIKTARFLLAVLRGVCILTYHALSALGSLARLLAE
jgi:hypothetical protein